MRFALRVDAPHPPATEPRRSPGFYAVLALCYAFVVLVAVVAQPLGLKWRTWFTGAEGERSIRDAVSVSVFNLMSYME